MSDEIETKASEDAEIKSALIAEIKAEIKAELKADIKASKVPAQVKEDTGSMAEFLQLVGKTISTGREREEAVNVLANKYGSGFSEKAMTQGTTTAGGFTVPQAFVSELLNVEGYENIAYDNCSKFPCQSSVVKIPVLDQTSTPSGGDSAFYGGVAVAVVAEGSAPGSGTQAAFKQLSITPKQFLAYTQVSDALIRNSALAVESLIVDNFKKAMLSFLDYSVLVGGASQFGSGTGIVGHASTIKVPRNTTNLVKLVDLAKMYRRLPAASMKKACWIIHPYLIDQLVSLEDGNGNSVWLPNGQMTGNFDMRLFGLPVKISEHSPAIGTEGDVLLVDLDHYALAISQDITIEASRDFAFTSNLTTYRMSFWCGGDSKLTDPIILADGTSTVSAFVSLDDLTS